MFCKNCGDNLNEEAAFCKKCGTAVQAQQVQQPQFQSNLVGFSSKINDPAFTKYQKNSAAWSLIFSAILFVAAVVGFPLYGHYSGEIDWPSSLFYGLGIGGMFVVIALLQILKRGIEKTWDGVVVDKNTYIETSNGNDSYQRHRVFVLKIKKDNGGTKKHKWRDLPGAFEYYNIGDRVRHHKGFYYYEKYDKSQDNKIMCAACMSFEDIHNDVCSRCKCPLLK